MTQRPKRSRKKRRRLMKPSRDRSEQVSVLIRERSAGMDLRIAAAIAGIHVATVCRWQRRDPELREALEDAAREGWHVRHPPKEPRPHVRWRRDCPVCKARVVVRTTAKRRRFWRCGRWPLCPWSSWRPRAPRNCKRCGAPRFWSHSRESIVCDACGMRTRCL